MGNQQHQGDLWKKFWTTNKHLKKILKSLRTAPSVLCYIWTQDAKHWKCHLLLSWVTHTNFFPWCNAISFRDNSLQLEENKPWTRAFGFLACWGLCPLDPWGLHPNTHYIVNPSTHHIVNPSTHHIVNPSIHHYQLSCCLYVYPLSCLYHLSLCLIYIHIYFHITFSFYI